MDSNSSSRVDTIIALASLLLRAAGLIAAVRDRSRPRIILGLVGLGFAVRSAARTVVRSETRFGIELGPRPEGAYPPEAGAGGLSETAD